MDNKTIITVANRAVGTLGYDLPELRVSRHFEPKEVKEIPFEELKALYQTIGGRNLIEDCLSIDNREAIKALNMEVEQEYFYTEDDIKRVMVNGSVDEFLDMLDFGPAGVKDIVKNLAVSLPLNDVEKRDIILEKLNFNVTKAIEIQNTKLDGGDEDPDSKSGKKMRRVSAGTTSTEQPAAPSVPARRVVRK